MANRWKIDVRILEQGDIYFFYKPRRGIVETKSVVDVSRFFIVLAPEGDKTPRYIVMGGKRIPAVSDGGESTWGFVQMVGGRGFMTDSTRMKSQPKGASRPAGEGIYAIVEHRDHSHLLYVLELPQSLGVVQKAFHIQKEANYIFLNRPVRTPPASADALFSNFSKATIENLNRRGTEILLVGVGSDVGRLGIRAEKEQESFETADIFSKLHVDTDRHPPDSLISGTWV